MINEDSISEILTQYKRFGWQLERVLLSKPLRENLDGSVDTLFERRLVRDSDLDAAWFSRRATNGRIAWELRALSNSPFALVDSSEPEASESDLSEMFSRVEDEMRQRSIRPFAGQ